MQKLNCWEFKNCGRQAGGANVESMGVCPAATLAVDEDGCNEGEKGGRMCWAVAGTFCKGKVQGSFASKVADCTRCDFLLRVRAEEGPAFKFLTPEQEFEQVHHILGELEALARQREMTIRELSTPVMEVWDDVLVLPVVGVVDTRRSLEIMNTLLDRIVATKARCVIIDITGVEVVDTKTADYLLRVSRAANLLGTRCVLTGLSSAVAQTLVDIGADLTEVRTLRSLKDGLRDCLKYLRDK
jgi:rsbT co-antagonist protein RsbR